MGKVKNSFDCQIRNLGEKKQLKEQLHKRSSRKKKLHFLNKIKFIILF